MIMKIPEYYTYTFPCHINDMDFYYHDGKEWIELKKIMERMKEQWGGYGANCGGAVYWIVLGVDNEAIVSVDYQYQACIPTVPAIQNYAYSDIKFVKIGDIKIIDCRGDEFIFRVRPRDDFIEQLEILGD
jgi:hypothetical protein